MIHSLPVYMQYLKHMDRVRAGINYSGEMVPGATFHSHQAKTADLQPASIKLASRKWLRLSNSHITGQKWDMERWWETFSEEKKKNHKTQNDTFLLRSSILSVNAEVQSSGCSSFSSALNLKARLHCCSLLTAAAHGVGYREGVNRNQCPKTEFVPPWPLNHNSCIIKWQISCDHDCSLSSGIPTLNQFSINQHLFLYLINVGTIIHHNELTVYSTSSSEISSAAWKYLLGIALCIFG